MLQKLNNSIYKFKKDRILSKLKSGGAIPKFQWGSIIDNIEANNQQMQQEFVQPIIDYSSQIVSKGASKKAAERKLNRKIKAPIKPADNSVLELQDKLWRAGAFKGVKNRRGRELTYEQAVDGINGNWTKQAMANYEKIKQQNSTSINKEQSQKNFIFPQDEQFFLNFNPNQNSENINYKSQNVNKKIPENSESKNNGHVIYLHYPNFQGSTENAIKIGNFDIGNAAGKALGISQLPVGHAAAITIGPNNKSTYYEYGRYTNDTKGTKIFGHKRPTTKGGNWRKQELPPIKPEENDSSYLARVQHLLPDTNTGAYQAMTLPNVDTQKVVEYINKQANDVNRPEYSALGNTCANGICNSIFPYQTELPSYSLSRVSNENGYSSTKSKLWSLLPNSTGMLARQARRRASNVYVMNE